MNIYVDIDETICFYSGEREYHLAEPNHENIAKINKLYDEGNQITYYTARGTINRVKRVEFYNLTEEQLRVWGAKHHKLIVGHKPAYDLMICDKTKRIEEI
jgi:hypothetical protein